MGAATAAVFGDEPPLVPNRLQRRFVAAAKLHSTVDGKDLTDSRLASVSTAWLRDDESYCRGWRSVAVVRVHSGSIPSRVRCSRGRRGTMPVQCRVGCECTETAAHAVQVCPATRAARMGRHNYLCRMLSAYARKCGWSVWEEPHFQLGTRGLRPDIVVRNRTGTYVVDVAVCSSSDNSASMVTDLKIARYDTAEMRRAVAGLTGCLDEELTVVPVVLSWKGVWGPKSVKELKKMGYPGFVMRWAAVAVLAGSSMCWSAFMKEVRRRRRGRPPR